ncbi:hypothetical protein F2Q70_00044716 [Brassica cretica]|uniref:Uncharacterized protein n=1 Tax=Brassica cretica TaxID=69181 RepID=A0A8S9KIC5_BRACR|nr:hypothetical protein F2Q70_00044716 [Brassica cretica]KAF2607423.1 hypothetical protein F2Q68_00045669 [Brassica cretica]
MAEDDGYSDGSESNFSSSRNQQKRETHCKNDVRFPRNTTCMGGSSEWHEVLEIGRRGWPEQQCFVERPRGWKDPYQQFGSMDLLVASDHNFKLVSVQIDH